MLRIFSTHRLFAFLLTGLMITSCGGNTSSNTPTSDRGVVTPPTTPPSLTVSVPSLGTSYTVTKSTTFAEINRAATEGAGECVNRYGISQRNTTCQAEVRAAQSQAVAFINR